jgi:hypothetical protein
MQTDTNVASQIVNNSTYLIFTLIYAKNAAHRAIQPVSSRVYLA